jgi:uncharacterized protein involved in exopolysaccharide biosynthesis
MHLTVPSSDHYEDEIDLRRYGGFLASYWMVLMTSLVAGALGGLALAPLLVPVRFQATTTLTLGKPNSDTAVALTPDTSAALLANLTLVSETIGELGLNRDGLTAQSFVEDALEIQPVPTTNLVKLMVALPDPTKARLAAALLAKKAVELSRRVDHDGATAARETIARQMTEAEARLKKAQQRLLDFETSAGIDLLEAETTSKLARRAEVAAIGIRLESERARLASLEEDLSRQPAELTAPRARGADAELRAGRQMAPADGANPFANPVYAMLQYDIALSRATISSLERQRRQTIDATGGAKGNQRAELHQRRLTLMQLQADYDLRSRVYAELSSRYEEAGGRLVASTPQLQILAGPVQPDQPMPRRRRQCAILGGLIGLVCGIAAAFVIDRRKIARPTTV